MIHRVDITRTRDTQHRTTWVAKCTCALFRYTTNSQQLAQAAATRHERTAH